MGFQLTGAEGHFKLVDSTIKDDDAQILLKAEDNEDAQKLHVAEYTSAQLNTIATNGSFECLNCAVRITDPVTCSKATVSANGGEITLSFTNIKFEAYINFNFAGDPNEPFAYWKKADDYIGKKFLFDGIYTYHQTATKVYYQFVFNGASGITVVA